MRKIVFILLLLGLPAAALLAQDQPDSAAFRPQYRHGLRYLVKVNSGMVYSGFVTEESKDFITLNDRSKHETYELRKSTIVYSSLYSGRGDYNDLILGPNPHARNYLVAESAFLFEENKARSVSHWFLLENLDYAFTENWAVVANSITFYPFSLGVKCAFKTGDLNYIGGSAFAVGNPFSSSTAGPPLWGYGACGRFTRGNSNNNFTVSGGVLGINSELFFGTYRQSYVNLGFGSFAYCNRFSKHVAFNLEAWYMPRLQSGLAGIGFKFIGDERSCWSLGCYNFFNSYNSVIRFNFRNIPIPYIGLTRKFD